MTRVLGGLLAAALLAAATNACGKYGPPHRIARPVETSEVPDARPGQDRAKTGATDEERDETAAPTEPQS